MRKTKQLFRVLDTIGNDLAIFNQVRNRDSFEPFIMIAIQKEPINGNKETLSAKPIIKFSFDTESFHDPKNMFITLAESDPLIKKGMQEAVKRIGEMDMQKAMNTVIKETTKLAEALKVLPKVPFTKYPSGGIINNNPDKFKEGEEFVSNKNNSDTHFSDAMEYGMLQWMEDRIKISKEANEDFKQLRDAVKEAFKPDFVYTKPSLEDIKGRNIESMIIDNMEGGEFSDGKIPSRDWLAYVPNKGELTIINDKPVGVPNWRGVIHGQEPIKPTLADVQTLKEAPPKMEIKTLKGDEDFSESTFPLSDYYNHHVFFKYDCSSKIVMIDSFELFRYAKKMQFPIYKFNF